MASIAKTNMSSWDHTHSLLNGASVDGESIYRSAAAPRLSSSGAAGSLGGLAGHRAISSSSLSLPVHPHPPLALSPSAAAGGIDVRGSAGGFSTAVVHHNRLGPTAVPVPVPMTGAEGGPSSAALAAAALADGGSAASSGGAGGQRNDRRRKPNFAEKLHAVLSNKDCRHAVAWLPSGRSFCITDQEEFVKKILPKYFREAKFDSFSRR